jgi:DNA-binding PadR family transcriptional regulator
VPASGTATGCVRTSSSTPRGASRSKPGTLYRHIRKLQSDGLVDETEPRPAGRGDDERRIYYRLLPFGRQVLAAELERLRALMRIVEANAAISPRQA